MVKYVLIKSFSEAFRLLADGELYYENIEEEKERLKSDDKVSHEEIADIFSRVEKGLCFKKEIIEPLTATDVLNCVINEVELGIYCKSSKEFSFSTMLRSNSIRDLYNNLLNYDYYKTSDLEGGELES